MPMNIINIDFIKKIKNKSFILILIACLITFSYIAVYVLTANIHGDAFSHTFYAQEIIETQNLIDHQPYHVLAIKEGNIIYAPISYPLTYHTLLSILYIFGGKLLLKLSSPLFAAFTVCIIYLLLRRVNRYLGLFAGFFGIVLSSHRFIMAPLMEQYLIPLALLAILFMYRFYTKGKNVDAILSGLFIGLTMAIKQQGIVLGVFLILFVLISYTFKKKIGFSVPSAKHLLLILSLSFLVASIPLYDQIERTGTIGYSPGGTRIPDFIPFSSYINENILKSHFPVDIESQKWEKRTIGYRLGQLSIADTYRQYVLFPVYYNRWNTYSGQLDIFIFSIFFLLGLVYVFRRDRIIFYLLLTAFLSSFLLTWIWDQRIYQYHSLGIIAFSLFLAAGIFKCASFLGKLKLCKVLVSLFFVYLIVTLSSSWVTYIHNPLWKQEGRQSDVYLNAYQELGEFVKENTPEDALFLAAETNFRYFARRNSIWVSIGGGSKIVEILESTDPKVAMKWLKHYNISYIVINKDQTKRGGVYDHLPSKGLLEYIDSSEYFQKEYVSQNGKLVLYKVVDYSNKLLEGSNN